MTSEGPPTSFTVMATGQIEEAEVRRPPPRGGGPDRAPRPAPRPPPPAPACIGEGVCRAT